jgi:hypothetical protein
LVHAYNKTTVTVDNVETIDTIFKVIVYENKATNTTLEVGTFEGQTNG